jgi:hypothetical protein
MGEECQTGARSLSCNGTGTESVKAMEGSDYTALTNALDMDKGN